ncbi:hypothetical protein EV421DRAFT_1865620 [Armillaria borealis]|uniref:Uncharacterized protein n=1 Tax=Armillaria borealis TaxID=47425 RepID=A0AA39IUS2_9AGAR|nr:hypothetical protein EV421DRAFT_1865620 [Armillaria borealis]
MSSLQSLAFTTQLLPRVVQENTRTVPVVLASITRLSCVIVQLEIPLDSESSDSMLSLLVLPSLDHLDISYKNIQSSTAAADAGDGVVHMLQRSSCALKTLKLSVWGPVISDPLRLLQCGSSSSLEEISILGFPFDRIRDILSHPYIANDTALFLPKLHSTEIDVSSPSLTPEEYKLFEGYIRLFLESREAGGAALNRLHIHSQAIYTMSDFLKGRLLTLCDRGLCFYISRYDLNDPQPF